MHNIGKYEWLSCVGYDLDGSLPGQMEGGDYGTTV